MTAKNTARAALLALQPRTLNFTLEVGGQALSLQARQLTGAEADAVSDNALDETTGDLKVRDFYSYRIIASTYDQATNKPLFGVEDFEALNGIPVQVLNKLREKVSEVNNDLTQEDVDNRKKPSKETGKNA